MKKTLVVILAVVAMIATMACGGGSGKLKSNIDSLSYAIGVDNGLNIRFNSKELELDQTILVDCLKDFIVNGDIESEEFMQEMQQLQMFQFTRFMPYMQVVGMHERSDRTDTLPAIPELYDEQFKREDISRYIAHKMGANIKGSELDIVMPLFDAGVEDALKVESEDKMDETLRISTEQMQQLFAAYAQKKRAEAEAEFKAAAETNIKESAEWLAEVEKMEGVKKTESGLLYRIDREGDGKNATKDEDIVKVNYEGKTRDGKIFDSSYERGKAIEFGLNQVIKGWTEGMKLVKTGGQITLWIPAELAYGERGAGQDIGPNEALEFKVELLEVNPKK